MSAVAFLRPCTMPFKGVFTVVLSLGGLATAHFAAWHKGWLARFGIFPCRHANPFLHAGMYCLNGTTVGYDDSDTNSIVNPLFNVCGSFLGLGCPPELIAR